MNQEGRGIGLLNKLKAYVLQENGKDTVEANVELGFLPDHRDYGIGAQILRAMNATKIKLLTNNPQKVGLNGYGITIVDTIPIEIKSNIHNNFYLKTKRQMGHSLKKLMNKKPIILGIESSCDDTSAAILRGRKILSNEIANQKVHAQYGGVVPELASRAHQKNIIPVVDLAIKKAKITKEEINAVAFTKGPGLLGSLLVGGSFAKSFALGMDIPLIAVNHMQAHILAHLLMKERKCQNFLSCV